MISGKSKNLGWAAVAGVDPRRARKITGKSRKTPAREYMCLLRDIAMCAAYLAIHDP